MKFTSPPERVRSRLALRYEVTEVLFAAPEGGWILSGAESAQEPDRYGDDSSANP